MRPVMRRFQPLLKEPAFWLVAFSMFTHLYLWSIK